MMHQKVEPPVESRDRPKRERIIQNDEILGLIIDLHVLTSDQFLHKYGSLEHGDEQLR